MKATWRRISFRNGTSMVAIVGLFLLSMYTVLYILDHQRLRLPLLDEPGWTLKAEFTTAQAVIPGQGQTVRVSGVRIGDISAVKLSEGRAVVTMDVDHKYRKLVHRDATALLRPKTGLKDMFIELNPGREGPPVESGYTIPLRSTLPDVNSDELFAMLDRDTRDYLKMLVGGLGQGLRGQGTTFGQVMRKLEPTHRDLARVSHAVAQRDRNLRRVINHLALLNGELAGHDDDLARLVDRSAVVFQAFASEERNISRTVAALPEALRETTRTLGKVDRFAKVLAPASVKLRPPVRALTRANAVVAPAARAITPIVRDDVRPFTREAQPLVAQLHAPAKRLADAAPDITRVGVVTNHFLNMLAYNPGGREGPEKAGREEGYLFWLAWLGHIGVNIFPNADAHGTFRPVTFASTCHTLQSFVGVNPEQEFMLNLTPILTSPNACGGKG